MKTVLVPIDGSRAALRAMALAVNELRHKPGARLHLVNVQPGRGRVLRGLMPLPQPPDSDSQRRGMELLARARELAEDSGVPTELHVCVGPPAESIVGCADEAGCDAIVMGADETSAAPLANCSLTARVVHLGRLPVTVVK